MVMAERAAPQMRLATPTDAVAIDAHHEGRMFDRRPKIRFMTTREEDAP